jgi:hypothetical protein
MKKPLPRTVKVRYQVGTSNRAIDKALEAMTPGRRLSKSGKTYWEYRMNRSDVVPKKGL